MSPTQRSLAHLRKLGWLVGVVEFWNPHVKQRKDLFGFADLVAVHPDHPGTHYIQVTSTGVSERVKKILAEPRAQLVLEAGNRVWVHGWRKLKKRKKDGSYSKVYQYVLREIEITAGDFDGSPDQ